MARKNEAQTSSHLNTAPDFLAWHVTNRGAKSFWNKVGAAWKHMQPGARRMRSGNTNFKTTVIGTILLLPVGTPPAPSSVGREWSGSLRWRDNVLGSASSR